MELILELPRNSKYVFPSKNGSYYRDIGYHWYKALQVAEIKDFRLHDTRHTAASYLAMQGVGYPRKAGQFGVGHVLYGTKFTHEFSHPAEDRPTWDIGLKAA